MSLDQPGSRSTDDMSAGPVSSGWSTLGVLQAPATAFDSNATLGPVDAIDAIASPPR